MALKWVDGKLVEDDRLLGGNFNTIAGGSGTSIGPGGSNIGNFSNLDGYGLGANQSLMQKQGLFNTSSTFKSDPVKKDGLFGKGIVTGANMDIFSSAMSGVGSAIDALMAFKTYKLNKQLVEDNRKLTQANYGHQLGVTNYEIREDNAFKNANAMYASISPELKNAYT